MRTGNKDGIKNGLGSTKIKKMQSDRHVKHFKISRFKNIILNVESRIVMLLRVKKLSFTNEKKKCGS